MTEGALPGYEYKGLIAQCWDIFRGDTSQWSDRFFYLEVIRKFGQPVLDVGCGTGRLLLDYLAQGIDIDGVDNSPDMLAICRQKAIKLGLTPNAYEQYIERLELPRHYRTILVPSSTLQLITEPSMVTQAVRRLLAHLRPGGALAASFMALWRPGEPLASEFELNAIRPDDGATIRRRIRQHYDPDIECEHTEDLWQIVLNGKIVAEELHQRSPATRSYTQSQARALFESAGFTNVQLYHADTFEPVKPTDTGFTLVAQKPDRA